VEGYLARQKLWALLLLGVADLNSACRHTASFAGPEFSKERARLRETLGNPPAAGPRLVGGLTVMQSLPGSSPPVLDANAIAAIIAIQRRAERNPNAESLADLGVVRALLGRSREAVADLKQAADLSPSDARIHSDLGAVYLSDAGAVDGPARLAALDEVSRALELAPELTEARANLALALAANFLIRRPAARTRSGNATRKSPDLANGLPPTWPAALARLESCSPPCAEEGEIFARFPREVRKFAEERLLPHWAETVGRGETREAERILGFIAHSGRAAVDCCGESMLSEAAADLRRAEGRTELHRLAHDVRQATEGLRMCQANEGVRGMALLTASARDFASEVKPLREWAEYGRGLCAYQSARFDLAISILTAVERDLGGRYPALRMRLLWVRAASLGRSGRHGECLRDYRVAHELAERAGALAERAGVNFNISEKLWLLGQRRVAWPWLFEGCRLAVEADEARRLSVAFAELYQAAQESGLTRAALRFADRLVELSMSDLGQAGVAHALYTRGRAQAALGRRDAALQDLASAEHAVAALSDERSRRQWQSDIWGERGRLLLETAPAKALAEIQRAARAAEALHDAARIVRFLVELSRAQSATGSPEAASSLGLALVEVERERSNLVEEEGRADFLVQSRAVYDQWMAAALDGHEAPEVIFGIADRARARVLRDALGLPAVSAGIAHGLGPAQALVEFAVLPHKLLTWVLHDGRLSYHVRPVEESDLEAWVRTSTEGTDEARRTDAVGRLSQLLTEPIAAEIAGVPTVLVSPDKSLRRVPFAELNETGGRRLVENHALAIAPSAALAVAASARTWSAPESAFVLADPRLAASTFAFLPALPAAREEARRIASLFAPESFLRLGEAATASSLLRGFGRYELVHIAAHVLANDEHPEMTTLPLSQATSDDPVALTAADVRHLHAGRTRLVVLSACHAAGSTDSEGSRGLAEAFLGAGVPQVVAALWDVNDRAAAVFFENFYRHLRAGDEPPEALRAAQLALLHGNEPKLQNPAAWAGYEVFRVPSREGRNLK
jgi:CHAT domain-containing protein/tetratricopeptide (TPR) repeat protein